LITRSSINEDGLGEELEVIWEIEPGAQIIERAGLPSFTGQEDSDTLETFLDAVRWGAATNADRGFLQAPFRSGVSIEDFQLDPLVRAIDIAREAVDQYLKEFEMLKAGKSPDGVGAFDD